MHLHTARYKIYIAGLAYILQVAILLVDFMGQGDTENTSQDLDDLLLYLGLQLAHVQLINVKGKVTNSYLNSLDVSLIKHLTFKF